MRPTPSVNAQKFSVDSYYPPKTFGVERRFGTHVWRQERLGYDTYTDVVLRPRGPKSPFQMAKFKRPHVCTIQYSTGQSDLNDHLLSHLMGKITKKTIPRKKVKVKTSSSKQKPSLTKSAKKPPHKKYDTKVQPGLTKESKQASQTMPGEEQPSVDDSFNKPSSIPPHSHDYRVLKNRNIRFTKKCVLCKGLPFTTYSVSPIIYHRKKSQFRLPMLITSPLSFGAEILVNIKNNHIHVGTLCKISTS